MKTEHKFRSGRLGVAVGILATMFIGYLLADDHVKQEVAATGDEVLLMRPGWMILIGLSKRAIMAM